MQANCGQEFEGSAGFYVLVTGLPLIIILLSCYCALYYYMEKKDKSKKMEMRKYRDTSPEIEMDA